MQPVYAGIIVKTRELTVMNMMAGQLASDALNQILKYAVKQERPQGEQHMLDFCAIDHSYCSYKADSWEMGMVSLLRTANTWDILLSSSFCIYTSDTNLCLTGMDCNGWT